MVFLSGRLSFIIVTPFGKPLFCGANKVASVKHDYAAAFYTFDFYIGARSRYYPCVASACMRLTHHNGIAERKLIQHNRIIPQCRAERTFYPKNASSASATAQTKLCIYSSSCRSASSSAFVIKPHSISTAGMGASRSTYRSSALI